MKLILLKFIQIINAHFQGPTLNNEIELTNGQILIIRLEKVECAVCTNMAKRVGFQGHCILV